MPKGLVFYTDQYVAAVVKDAPEASARDHIANGYPELLDDFDGGRVMARETDLPEETALTECSFDGEKFTPLSAEAKTAQEKDAETRWGKTIASYEKLLAKIDRETRRFTADRLLNDARLTREEYNILIARIGQD